MKHRDLLAEIGTEELPPKALRALMDAFGDRLAAALADARLEHGTVETYASPRRLAVIVRDLADRQPDREETRKGPPVRIAFDEKGEPTQAAIAFADKCGVGVDDLDRVETPKGEWLTYDVVEKGAGTARLIGGLIERALEELPIPRRMRWGASSIEFVRPAHWVVLLYGEDVVETEVLGIAAGRETRGHRFHMSGPVTIDEPDSYLDALEQNGHVIADFDRRRELIETGVAAAAKEAGGRIVDGEALYDEVAALVEWPVPVLGSFEERYLELPREVVIATLSGHQRYFAIEDENGKLLPRFVTVANLDSRDPDRVRDGNERVVRPRLADAAFFWDTDRQVTLAQRQATLAQVVYQQGLGTLADKSGRVASIAASIARALGVDDAVAIRAAELAKCDLVTGMVGEFPELQGTMGRYYALADGEPAAVATAIGDQYLPRFAGDGLPATLDGQILAVADRIDTLAGIFASGKRPSGNRDPFGLRRAALGIIRILVEREIDLDVQALIRTASEAQPESAGKGKNKPDADEVAREVSEFVSDRLRRYFLDRDPALTGETFDAVLARAPASLLDFANRLAAVQAFVGLDEAASLAAANKRIGNILKKAEGEAAKTVDSALFTEDAERSLHEALEKTAKKVRPLLEERSYTDALTELSSLRSPVDRFFDDVMVMAEEDDVRANRLALLSDLRDIFLDVADISRLDID